MAYAVGAKAYSAIALLLAAGKEPSFAPTLAADGISLDEAPIDLTTLLSQLAGPVDSALLALLTGTQGTSSSSPLEQANALCAALDRRLTLRTFLDGHGEGPADLLAWGVLRGNGVVQGIIKKGAHVHLKRWYDHVAALPVPSKAAALSIEASKPVKAPKEAGKKDEPAANASFELGLPNAIKGQVVTRLPPEPSGYLHIGHAKAAILNQYFARAYDGKFLVRFDDTNPSKEKAEFEESIIEDLALLGIKEDARSYTSDHFEHLLSLGLALIKQGDAYCDDTLQLQMREERMNGIASGRRDATMEENLSRFAEMQTGSEEGQKWCLRAKMSVDDPNKALRDPVIYRCNMLPHHRTGTTWKVYPTYDFACPVVDSLEGVTHALRTNEYRDRNPQYQWFLTKLNLRTVHIWDFGRVNFVYTLLSKRKLKWFVEEGLVGGWDDPRFPTVRGIRRRGMTIEAIKQYMLMQGPSQAFTSLEWDTIWSLNKKIIDPVVGRHTCIEDGVPVEVVGEGLPAAGEEVRDMPKHKKNAEVGTKRTTFGSKLVLEQVDAVGLEEGEEVTMMDWGNVFVRSVVKSADGKRVESVKLELHLEGDFKKTKKKLTWLSPSDNAANKLVDVLLLDYDYLITKKKLEEDDSVENFITPTSEFVTRGVADANVKELKKGDILQFERKGYFIVDKAFGEESTRKDGSKDQVELVLIPDGRAVSVASKAASATAAAAPAPAAKKEGGKKGKAPAAAAASAAALAKIPDPAPTEPVETILLSEGKTGFEQPITSKMYRVPSIYGDDGVNPQADNVKMYTVPSPSAI